MPKDKLDVDIAAWNWSHDSDSATVKGRVKNLTDRPLEGVRVTVTWKDRAGEYITHDDCFAEYDPLMPGHTSPFDVFSHYNPLMYQASVEAAYGTDSVRPLRGIIKWKPARFSHE